MVVGLCRRQAVDALPVDGSLRALRAGVDVVITLSTLDRRPRAEAEVAVSLRRVPALVPPERRPLLAVVDGLALHRGQLSGGVDAGALTVGRGVATDRAAPHFELGGSGQVG